MKMLQKVEAAAEMGKVTREKVEVSNLDASLHRKNWLESCEQNTYNKEAATYLSTVTGWSYSDKKTFKNKLAEIPGLGDGKYVEISVRNEAMLVIATAQIIITADNRSMIICFRGTELTNIVNWLVDAECELVELPGKGNKDIQVHKGFLRNFQEVWNGHKGVRWYLGRALRQQDDDSFEFLGKNSSQVETQQEELKNIFVCGHSLGASMAFLCGMALQQDEANKMNGKESYLWNKVRGIYTYGQPMVISNEENCVKQCKDRIGDRLFRHVYENDVVPHVPPLSTGVFDHIGTEYRYKGDKKAWVKRSGKTYWWFFKDQATQVGVLAGTLPFALTGAIVENIQWLQFLPRSPWSFTDHSPLHYMEALKNPSQEDAGMLLDGSVPGTVLTEV